MSFGYALGDFVLLTQLAWDVVQNSRKACGAHDELTSEVASLHIVLRRLEIEVSKPNSILTRSEDSLDRREELAQLSGDCKRVLRVLHGILEKYNALSEEKRSVTKLWKRVQFGNGEMLDLAELRVKIATNTSALTLFLNLLSIGSQGKVESYMESQGDELREMRRSLNWITASMQAKSPKAGEGSILTTYAGDDKAIWKDFRRELIKEGFSSGVLQRHKETIKDYVMELGDRGALDDNEDDFGVGDLSLEGMTGNNELEDRNEEEEEVEVEEEQEEKEVENSEPEPQEEPVADAVESSDETSEGGPGETLEQCSGPRPEQQSDRIPTKETTNDNGEPGLQRNTQTPDPGATFETTGDGVHVNNKEPLSYGNQHNLEGLSILQTQPVDGDAPVTSKLINAVVESQTDHDSEPMFFGVGNLDESKIEGAVENAKIAARESSRSSLQPSVSTADISKVPRFHYDPDFYVNGTTESLVGVTGWSVGPYKYIPILRRPWSVLSVMVTALFSSEGVPSTRPPHIYRPHALCYEILCLAHWYEQAQATIRPSSTSTDLLSIADEFQRLVAHASAYYDRIQWPERVQSPKRLQFLSFYRIMLRDFYCWVREGIRYSQAYESEENQSATRNSIWKLDESLYLKQRNVEWVWHMTSTPQKVKARSLHELGTRAALGFIYHLFEDELVRSRLTGLITNVQSLLLFFKRWCEDDLLQEERNQSHHSIQPHHPISEHEMRNSDVANAAYEVKMCKVALETWAFQNDFSKERVTTKRFARSENSLSAILERFDESQVKLYLARELLHLPVFPEGVPLGKARSGKREGKKKK
ncbi:hypothetical protein F5882DRAFT_404444 [Hyaloscypha sp. PMI_1271]|nr:hypothetical protein F5882DRAFT_404444 [Hyaloscypha sp. PMI_1271]